jgi:Osmosensitive K+ channel histidine kinase
MRVKLFIKLFLACLFIFGLTSIFLFAWLAGIDVPLICSNVICSYVVYMIIVCLVTSFWLARGFHRILCEYDNSLHVLTHDLRNPISAIRGFLDFLLKETPGPLNPTQRKMLSSVDHASLRLLGMVNNILDSAKAESGKMQIELTSVNLRSVASGVLNLMSGLGEHKHLKFSLEGDDVTVNADAVLIERLLTNLIGNAIKFTQEGGSVGVGVKEDGRWAVIWVKDDGEGISQEHVRDIFEKYKQAGRKGVGTGLGLSICRFIAHAHRGEIRVESAPGRGSKFIVRFPKNLRCADNGSIVY